MPKQVKRWALYPSFHDTVVPLLEDFDLAFTFYPLDEDDPSPNFVQAYNTTIIGRFTCRNPRCTNRKSWTSGKIAIRIRQYTGRRYNARVYFQQCQACRFVSKPVLDADCYAERVAYRLKKWAGIEMEAPPYDEDRQMPPHEVELCEGCKAGHCVRGGGRFGNGF